MSKMTTAGFYATDVETFYVTPSGRTWIVASEDDLGTDSPVEIDALPESATAADSLLTPVECVDHCRRIESESGESLLTESAD